MNEMTQSLDRVQSESPDSTRAINILIVDDDGFDRENIRRLCKQTGLQINFHEAGTVPEMKDALDALRFDLVFLDYYLGSSNGIEVLKDVKAHPLNNSVATIMIAGKWQTEHSRAAINLGCGDYIEKDCLDPTTIQRAIVKALRTSCSQETQSISENEDTSLEPVLKLIKEDFAKKISPSLSEWFDQIAKVRGTQSTPIDTETSGCFSEIEASYLRLVSAVRTLGC